MIKSNIKYEIVIHSVVFWGLRLLNRFPDTKTIWLFREQLVKFDLMKVLFYGFDEPLNHQGYQGRKGQIVDASFVDVPKQRNTREENTQIKAGEIPQRFTENPKIGSQKDTDARWTKKNNEVHFGYQDHATIDNVHKLIREYDITSVEVHDSQVFEDILTENTSKDVWADSAYRSEAHEESLNDLGYRSHVHKKGKRNKPLSDEDQKSNKRKSTDRVRVEHVFGSMTNEQGGLYFRVIGFSTHGDQSGHDECCVQHETFCNLAQDESVYDMKSVGTQSHKARIRHFIDKITISSAE